MNREKEKQNKHSNKLWNRYYAEEKPSNPIYFNRHREKFREKIVDGQRCGINELDTVRLIGHTRLRTIIFTKLNYMTGDFVVLHSPFP